MRRPGPKDEREGLRIAQAEPRPKFPPPDSIFNWKSVGALPADLYLSSRLSLYLHLSISFPCNYHVCIWLPELPAYAISTKYLHIYSTEQCLASTELLTPHPPLHPVSVSSPRTKGGGVHTRRAVRGCGGSIFRKTPDIGLTSYSIIPLRLQGCI